MCIAKTIFINTILKLRMRIIIKKAFSRKYLIFTNVMISSCLSGAGDVLEQRYEILVNHMNAWDRIRTRNMSISGITTGIVTHWWYTTLDRRVPGYSLRIVIRKVLLDQLICSPLTIATFFLTLALLERTKLDEACEEFRQKGWRLYAAEWVIWPPAQFINFYFLPNRFRVLYDSSISLFYDIYTSYVKNVLPLEPARDEEVTK